jgi:hypothetical protein
MYVLTGSLLVDGAGKGSEERRALAAQRPPNRWLLVRRLVRLDLLRAADLAEPLG